jgi:hypothetical protein
MIWQCVVLDQTCRVAKCPTSSTFDLAPSTLLLPASELPRQVDALLTSEDYPSTKLCLIFFIQSASTIKYVSIRFSPVVSLRSFYKTSRPSLSGSRAQKPPVAVLAPGRLGQTSPRRDGRFDGGAVKQAASETQHPQAAPSFWRETTRLKCSERNQKQRQEGIPGGR